MERSIEALRKATDEELIREHDAVARSTVTGTQYYLDELNRRANERATAAANALSHRIYVLTIAITVLSLVAVVVSVVALVFHG